jgi:CDGSH-type Zn-finger protein
MSDAVIAQKGPFAVELKAGRTYAWCSCGRSARQPFCDGTHGTTSMQPVTFKADEDGTAYLCGCKATSTPPFCDGTHGKL